MNEHCEVTLRSRPTAWQNFRWDVGDWFYDHLPTLVLILLLAFIVSNWDNHQELCSARCPATVNKVLYPDQSADVIPGDVRFTGSGPVAQGSAYRMPEHDCSTITGMQRGWLEYCGG